MRDKPSPPVRASDLTSCSSQGGTRVTGGGPAADFSWEKLKADKDKEYYLGASAHAVRPTFNEPNPTAGWVRRWPSVLSSVENVLCLIISPHPGSS